MKRPISASPPISRTRRRSAAAMSSCRKAVRSKPRCTVEIATRPRSLLLTHVLVGEPVPTSPGHALLPQHGDDAVQRLGRGFLVVHHGDADVVRAGIAAVWLLARAVASRQHAHAAFAPEPRGRDLAAALRRDVEP